MLKKIFNAISIGVGLTMTFFYGNFVTPIKVVGTVISLCILISGMIFNYRINYEK